MFYKIISFLVDYIVKKCHFCPKISKIRQYIEVIFFLKPMTATHTNNKLIHFPKFLCIEISALIGHISWLIITDLFVECSDFAEIYFPAEMYFLVDAYYVQ